MSYKFNVFKNWGRKKLVIESSGYCGIMVYFFVFVLKVCELFKF